MKNTFAIIALGAIALASHSASAQTSQPGSVQIYGILDGFVERVESGSVRETRQGSGSLSGSRLGFRGTESLGGGLSATFNIEMGFAQNTGELTQGGRAFGRTSLVGLAGERWSFNLGRQLVPMYYIAAAFDAMDMNTYGAGNVLMVGSGNSGVAHAVSRRLDNGFWFDVKLPYDIALRTAFTNGTQPAGGARVDREFDMSMKWGRGPIAVGMAYDRWTNVAGTTAGVEQTEWLLGASYDLSVVKAFVLYNTARREAPGVADRKDATYVLGLRYPITPALVAMGSYGRKDVKNSDNDGSQFALGLQYNLSRRTTLYTNLTRLTNEGTANFTLGGVGGNGRGDDPRGLNVGIRHRF